MLQSGIDTSGFQLQPQNLTGLAQGLTMFGQGIAERGDRKRKEEEEQIRKDEQVKFLEGFGLSPELAKTATDSGIDPRVTMALFSDQQNQQAAQLKAAQDEEWENRKVNLAAGDASAYAGLSSTDQNRLYQEAHDVYTKRRKAAGDAGKAELDANPVSGSDPLREQKIRDLINSGKTRIEAVDLVDNNWRSIVNETSGSAVLYNDRSGETRPIDTSPEMLGGELSERDSASTGKTLWDMSENTGFITAFRNAAQGITGQAGVQSIDEETQAELAAIQASARSAVQALILNRRYPIGEQKMIREELTIQPGVFRDPQTLRTKIRGIDRLLAEYEEEELAISADKDMPADERRNSKVAAYRIAKYRRLLGSPEYLRENIPANISVENWMLLSPEEKAEFLKEEENKDGQGR